MGVLAQPFVFRCFGWSQHISHLLDEPFGLSASKVLPIFRQFTLIGEVVL